MLNSAVINLLTLKKNALNIKSALPSYVKLIAVVKADAYGHGIAEVASALYTQADMFAVALPEEGVLLRQSGIDKDVLVLTPPVKTDFELGVRYDLTFTVDTVEAITRIEETAQKVNKLVKVHIAVNTGMNRFGVSPDKLLAILKVLKKSKHLTVDGVYSHFFQAENPLTRIKQSRIFKEAERLVKDYFPFAIAHISASGGYLKGEFYDAVRIGLLLYGYYPFLVRKKRAEVEPIMTLKAKVISVKNISKGERLLYGNFKVDSDSKIGLIRYGYADGLSRKKVLGQLNNRSMDVSAVDFAKNINKFQQKEENFYILYKNADEIAKKYDTISYEVLCLIAKRAKKIYIR